jgi:hypothetical protein
MDHLGIGAEGTMVPKLELGNENAGTVEKREFPFKEIISILFVQYFPHLF